jgi:hypothetical protein
MEFVACPSGDFIGILLENMVASHGFLQFFIHKEKKI